MDPHGCRRDAAATCLKNFPSSESAHNLHTGPRSRRNRLGGGCPHFAQAECISRARCAPTVNARASHATIDKAREARRTLPPVVGRENTEADDSQRPQRRICARRGCAVPVNKATAKYCSVRCCSLDPERHARLRVSARRSSRRVLPMTRQLRLGLPAANNPEAALALFSEGREDVPRGMSRLCS